MYFPLSFKKPGGSSLGLTETSQGQGLRVLLDLPSTISGCDLLWLSSSNKCRRAIMGRRGDESMLAVLYRMLCELP